MTREKAWVYQSTRPCHPCVAFLIMVFCVHLLVDQPQTGASGVFRQGRRHWPSITNNITSCWVTLLQPDRAVAVLDQLSSLRPHGMTSLCHIQSTKSPSYEIGIWLQHRVDNGCTFIERQDLRLTSAPEGLVEYQKTAFWRDPSVLQFRNSSESIPMQERFKFPGFYFYFYFKSSRSLLDVQTKKRREMIDHCGP